MCVAPSLFHNDFPATHQLRRLNCGQEGIQFTNTSVSKLKVLGYVSSGGCTLPLYNSPFLVVK